MPKTMRRLVLTASLVGACIGGGAIFLATSDAHTEGLREHVNSEWECEAGCSPDAQLCCGQE